MVMSKLGEVMASGKINYLSDKELLVEIHRSKCTYSSFKDEKYINYDYIITGFDALTDDIINLAKISKAEKLTQQKVAAMKEINPKITKSGVEEISPNDIKTEDIVFHVMTYDHIPMLPEEQRKKIKSEKDLHIKVSFPAWQHCIVTDNGIEVVGKSHWKGDVDTGVFCDNHGKITNQLARMYLLLVDRLGRNRRWYGYSYVDEMKLNALLHLSSKGLFFDESKSSSPFNYFTTVASNAFTRVKLSERRNQHIRDDLVIMTGGTPSYTRQNDRSFDGH